MDKKILIISFFILILLIISIVNIAGKVLEHKTTRIELLNGTYDGCLYVCTHKIFEWPSTKIACMHNCEVNEINMIFNNG